MRAVFDTNIVLSALVFRGSFAWLVEAWSQGRLRKVVSPQTIAELRRVLAYPKFKLNAERRERLVAEYLHRAEHVRPDTAGEVFALLCRDPKDRMFIILAITAKTPIVSGDVDLTVLKGRLPVDVLTLPELRQHLHG